MILSLPSWANALFAPSYTWLLAKVNDEVDDPDTNSNDAIVNATPINAIVDDFCFFTRDYALLYYKYVKYDYLNY